MQKLVGANRKDAVKLPLAVTCGEPSGIGPDIILDAWKLRNVKHLPSFYVLGDPNQLYARAKKLGVTINIKETSREEALSVSHDALPVCPLRNSLTESPGVALQTNTNGVVEAIDRAVEDALAGYAAGIVTAPIAKKVLYDSGFPHPGHTEYLAALAFKQTGALTKPVMMIAGPNLRTIPVTIHIALKDVAQALTTEKIIETVMIAHHDLEKRFKIKQPRIAISGLNPHSGENGAIGYEDIEIIVPAIEQLIKAGLNVHGPVPADTLFHERARTTYDVAVCMYHDQALIPVKALDFDEGVNVTLGLPFIRTSPDHGTAFNIAGKAIARSDSFIAALTMAATMAETHHNA